MRRAKAAFVLKLDHKRKWEPLTRESPALSCSEPPWGRAGEWWGTLRTCAPKSGWSTGGTRWRPSRARMARSCSAHWCTWRTKSSVVDIMELLSHKLYRLAGLWIWFADPPLARKWIQLLDPLLSLPCTNGNESLVSQLLIGFAGPRWKMSYVSFSHFFYFKQIFFSPGFFCCYDSERTDWRKKKTFGILNLVSLQGWT